MELALDRTRMLFEYQRSGDAHIYRLSDSVEHQLKPSPAGDRPSVSGRERAPEAVARSGKIQERQAENSGGMKRGQRTLQLISLYSEVYPGLGWPRDLADALKVKMGQQV